MDPLAIISQIGTYGETSGPEPIIFDDVENLEGLSINITTSDFHLSDYEVIYNTYNRRNHLHQVYMQSDKRFDMPESLIINNIDMVFRLSGHMGNYMATQTLGPLDFIEIGAPGSATEYLRYRKPDSYAFNYGTGPWNVQSFNMNHVNIVDPTDMDPMEFSNFVAATNDVDLVISQQLANSEYQQFNLMLNNALIALNTLKHGGNMIMRLGSLNSKTNRQLIYLLTSCFETSYFIAPFLAPDSQYLVGTWLKTDKHLEDTIRQLYKVIEINNYDDVISIFDAELPEFNSYMDEHHLMMSSLNYQSEYNYLKTWQTIN